MSRSEPPHRGSSAPMPHKIAGHDRGELSHLRTTGEDRIVGGGEVLPGEIADGHPTGCPTRHRRPLGPCQGLPSPVWTILEEGRPCLLVANRKRTHALAAAFRRVHPQRRYTVQEVRS